MLEEKRPSDKYAQLFAVLPTELQDTAFLDRIHAYLPGWEMPVINPINYATGYGFMTDYFAEILAEFRRRNFATHVAAQLVFKGMNERNEDSVKKTAAGMLKLLYPHLPPGEVPREQMEEVLRVCRRDAQESCRPACDYEARRIQRRLLCVRGEVSPGAWR